MMKPRLFFDDAAIGPRLRITADPVIRTMKRLAVRRHISIVADRENITLLLGHIEDDRSRIADELFPLIYDELRAIAASFFQRQEPGHTLQPTAIVHDAYLRLVRQEDVEWTGRAHFFAVAAKAMRQILINHARDRRAVKRGGDWGRITLDEQLTPATHRDLDIIALDEAMERLEEMDERQCRIVELRFFGGLTIEETGHVLDVSGSTVKSDWNMARSWLFDQLFGDAAL